VRVAIQNAQLEYPARRVTVSLGPADLPKDGGRFDLPIALGILAAAGQVPKDGLARCEFLGELALSGELRAVTGVLPAALKAAAAGRTLVVPRGNGAEAALVSSGDIRSAGSLLDVLAFLRGAAELPLAQTLGIDTTEAGGADLADVRGQMHARRALEIAAAGRHHLLFSGPPGTGKTMLASRLPGILPPLSEDEALESAAVRSVAGVGIDFHKWKMRQFRAPHHTASAVALVGGGSIPRPGEISLAHHGVLFLDELPEFDRHVLEVLREPLESGRIAISRAARQAEFPAAFQLVAAMNPCPCGYLGHPAQRCRCTPDQIIRYRSRISGPLLDRIDLQIEVPAVSADALRDDSSAEASADVQRRAEAARASALARQGKANALLGTKEIDRHCRADAKGDALLRRAIASLNLSARTYHRILKVARTIADLAGAEVLDEGHIAEAVQLRRLDQTSRLTP
jgi:magnesium chelatase family protein